MLPCHMPMEHLMQYDIILADPAWRFRVWSRDTGLGRSADSHYDTMPLKDIMALPVGMLARKNAMLFLWATMAMLPEALETGAAWGFKYKTVAFTWVKLNRRWQQYVADRGIYTTEDIKHLTFNGMGYYTRANPELCLLFCKGKPLKRMNRSVRQAMLEPIGIEHSEKPTETHRRIETLYGTHTDRIELFARKSQPGWTVLGNGIDGRDLRESIIHEAQRMPEES